MACSDCFLIAVRATSLGVTLRTMGWVLPYPSQIKKMPWSLAYSPIFGGRFSSQLRFPPRRWTPACVDWHKTSQPAQLFVCFSPWINLRSLSMLNKHCISERNSRLYMGSVDAAFDFWVYIQENKHRQYVHTDFCRNAIYRQGLQWVYEPLTSW